MAMDIPKLMRQHMTVNRRGLELNGVQKVKDPLLPDQPDT